MSRCRARQRIPYSEGSAIWRWHNGIKRSLRRRTALAAAKARFLYLLKQMVSKKVPVTGVKMLHTTNVSRDKHCLYTEKTQFLPLGRCWCTVCSVRRDGILSANVIGGNANPFNSTNSGSYCRCRQVVPSMTCNTIAAAVAACAAPTPLSIRIRLIAITVSLRFRHSSDATNWARQCSPLRPPTFRSTTGAHPVG